MLFFFWWLETFPLLSIFLLLGLVKLKAIFTKNHFWETFKAKYKEDLREVEIQEVEKIFTCRKSYKTYQCPHCGLKRRIPFSCKSRLCSSCGKLSTDKWTRLLEKKLLPVTHRHLVFTISDHLWSLIKQNRYLYDTLFKAVKRTLDRVVQNRYPSDQITLGVICAFHTGGKDLKFNPHIHAIVTEGGLNTKKEWVSYTYFPYAQLRRIWKYELLTGLKRDFNPANSPHPHEFFAVIEELFANRALEFYVRAKDRLYSGKGLIKYIIRYIRHPAIAESRIIKVEANQVTFWYERKDQESGHMKRYYVTMELDDFIWALLQQLPDRNFRMVRFYGLYSNRLRLLAKAALVLKDTLTSFYDLGLRLTFIKQLEAAEERQTEPKKGLPLVCPRCGSEMELIDIYIYPTKPPPPLLVQAKLIQEMAEPERISLIHEIIVKNHRYYPKGIPLRIIVAEANDYAIPELVCKRSLTHLVNQGRIFLPQLDHYLPIT